MIVLGKRLSGLAFIILSFLVVSISAYIYEQSSQTISQNIVEIATISLKNSDLGNINEGQTKTYTNETIPSLGNAISITITEENVKLHFNSNLDEYSRAYSTYTIDVVLVEKPAGSNLEVGSTMCTLSLSSPDYSSVNLDSIGTYCFNFEITTTANPVDEDTPTSITIVVSAQSS